MIYLVKASPHNEDYILDYGYTTNIGDCIFIIEARHADLFYEKIYNPQIKPYATDASKFSITVQNLDGNEYHYEVKGILPWLGNKKGE